MSVLIEAKSDGHPIDELLYRATHMVKKDPPRLVAKIRAERKKEAGGRALHIVTLGPTEVVDTVEDAIRYIKRDFSRAAKWAVVMINHQTRILEVMERQLVNTWCHQRHADATLRTRLRVTYWLLILTQRVGVSAEMAEGVLEEMEGKFSEFHHGWERTTTRAAVIDPEICDTTRCNYECLHNCPPRRAGFGEIGDKRRGLVISAENCIECGICVKKCPLGAIKIMEVPKW